MFWKDKSVLDSKENSNQKLAKTFSNFRVALILLSVDVIFLKGIGTKPFHT